MVIPGKELSSSLPETLTECSFTETSSNQATMPSNEDEGTGRGEGALQTTFLCVIDSNKQKIKIYFDQEGLTKVIHDSLRLFFFFLCTSGSGRDKECVRGQVWCEDSTGEGGYCCSHEDCSLDDIRSLPDPENVDSQR